MARITDLPLDIQHAIIFSLDDLESLRSLIAAVPSMEGALSASFWNIIMSFLPEPYREREVLAALCACVVAHYRNPVNGNGLRPFLTNFVENEPDPIVLPPDIPRNRASFEYIFSLCDAVEQLLPHTWPLVLGIPAPWSPAYDELFFGSRPIMLRIQLYIELFHRRLSDIRDWEHLRPDMCSFWDCFSSLNNLRCHFIYVTLLNLLHERDGGRIQMAGDPMSIEPRGLPLFLSVIDEDTITLRARRYINCLLEQNIRAFNSNSGYGQKLL